MIPTDARILQILTHPEVYPHIGDDYSPPVDEFRPTVAVYLEPVEGVLVMFRPIMATMWEAHIAALPEARGRGEAAVKLAVKWLRDNTQVQQVLAMFPEGSLAAGLVARCGFDHVGSVPDSFRRGGVLLPTHFYSLRVR